tara:strand:+ start:131 stop:628 length:498 start_codon:yes stop_codon:yes gene_type:complete
MRKVKKVKKENEEKYTKAIELKKQGVSRKDIAAELGVNERTITIWTQHIPRVSKKISREEHLQRRRDYYKVNVESERKRLSVSNARRRKEKKKWINDYKSSRGCCECGEKEAVCLDCHHVEDDKEFNIATISRTWSQEKIEKELKKCIIICANCHRKLHFKDDDD